MIAGGDMTSGWGADVGSGLFKDSGEIGCFRWRRPISEVEETDETLDADAVDSRRAVRV
jgi:hypothetical protein